MSYVGHTEFDPNQPPLTGVLVVNLGTPDAPDRKSVRRYLKQFLSDPRVVEFPRWIWWLILNGIILNIRPSKSAEAYKEIWTEQGSPLLVISNAQVAGMNSILRERYNDHIKVELGMSYGNPSIPDGLERLRQASVSNLIILPLYPQYSGSTVGSVFDAVTSYLRRWRWVPKIHFVSAYYDHAGYINALADKVRKNAQGDHLVMSFHGIPERYVRGGDPYERQCHKTAQLLASQLNLVENQWTIVFQSRFGREEWIKPYCDEQLKALPTQGVKSVDVTCPGFSADCLETLEEIDMQNRQLFMESGGEQFNYIACLNDDKEHLDFLVDLVTRYIESPGENAR
ncbi:MAG: ferrochelatase [Arenicellales bacterium]|nr:ferrochelatase [Arenicellales bacterium]